jgi:hypothetical protein
MWCQILITGGRGGYSSIRSGSTSVEYAGGHGGMKNKDEREQGRTSCLITFLSTTARINMRMSQRSSGVNDIDKPAPSGGIDAQEICARDDRGYTSKLIAPRCTLASMNKFHQCYGTSWKISGWNLEDG